ncbi:hypothetical protein Trco_004540 [Trichoderma cornu-damae]|uniref:Uncharacterized protein n=1 Tax=Trichoderma cornu-damae TaxID=654480 RepID=A0A9P8TXL8_9HYPO|nr:hypothetical protein Trco_004540 [Trichoderma cornu-damae]
MVNTTSLAASQPSPDEVVTDMNCEQDHSTPDDDQEEPLAHDSPAPVLSTVLCSNLLPAETVSSAETEQTAQADVLPNILEQAESIPSQQELSADSQPAIPMEHAYPDILERHANRGASEMPNEPLLTAPVTDGHSWAHQQEQQDETRPFPVATESPVTPSKSIDTHQPAPEDLPKSTEQASKRPSTPEPQFIFTHRSKGTRLQRVPSMPEQVSRDPEEQASAEDFAAARGEKKVSASQPSAWDDEDPTDVIQDMFNEMNDFLQVWDIDAELDEARKADKTRVTSKRGA